MANQVIDLYSECHVIKKSEYIHLLPFLSLKKIK